MIHRTYSELMDFSTLEDRFNYLKLVGNVGERTFGGDRIFNQRFYMSPEWKKARREVIIRDNGCDLGVDGYEIHSRATVHHLNPVTPEDIREEDWDKLLDPEGLITVSYRTHKAIHFSDKQLLPVLLVERFPGDTTLWK